MVGTESQGALVNVRIREDAAIQHIRITAVTSVSARESGEVWKRMHSYKLVP